VLASRHFKEGYFLFSLPNHKNNFFLCMVSSKLPLSLTVIRKKVIRDILDILLEFFSRPTIIN